MVSVSVINGSVGPRDRFPPFCAIFQKKKLCGCLCLLPSPWSSGAVFPFCLFSYRVFFGAPFVHEFGGPCVGPY